MVSAEVPSETWWPWLLYRLAGNPWRGPDPPQFRPVFRECIAPLRSIRVALPDHLFSASNPDLRQVSLMKMLAQYSVETQILAVDGAVAPSNFVRIPSESGDREVAVNWPTVSLDSTTGRGEISFVRDGSVAVRPLLFDDLSFHRYAGIAESPLTQLPVSDGSRLADASLLLLAKSLQCDLLISDVGLEVDTNSGFWAFVQIISPIQAIPLLGLYLRRQGIYRLDASARLGAVSYAPQPSGLALATFYLLASKALFSASRSWEGRCNRHATQSGDRQVLSHAAATYHRVEQALRARDRLLHAYASAPLDIGPGYIVGDEFDQLLLFLSGALDAASEVTNTILGLRVNKPAWYRPGLINALTAKSSCLWSAFSIGSSARQRRLLECISTLRNSIHSESISQGVTIYVVGNNAGEILLSIPRARFLELSPILSELGDLEEVGFRHPSADGAAQLHAGQFVEWLVPKALWLLNDIMKRTVLTWERTNRPWKQSNAPRRWPTRFDNPLSYGDQAALWQLALKQVG